MSDEYVWFLRAGSGAVAGFVTAPIVFLLLLVTFSGLLGSIFSPLAIFGALVMTSAVLLLVSGGVLALAWLLTPSSRVHFS
jgi:hypothetical protein